MSESIVQKRTTAEIETFLREKIALALQISVNDIRIDGLFVDLGLNSIEAVSISGELEEWLGKEVSPLLLYQYPSIQSLASYLEDSSNDA